MKNNLAKKLEPDKEKVIRVDFQNSKIDSDTFTPLDKSVGFGCWGKVDLYSDLGGNKWAIKYFSPNNTALKQMSERKWSEERVMREESVPLEAAQHHIVPRIIERDKNGKLYVAMPYYDEGDFSKKIRYTNVSHSLEIARDIADALSYWHKSKKLDLASKNFFDYSKRAHGDVKPANILIKNNRAFLSDFGSSTCISIGGSGSERGPHGDINYRAPECFKENAKPSTRADIWSLGSILYESIAREGIYKGTPEILELDSKQAQKIINKKIRKNIPFKLRGFVKKCLKIKEWERFYDGEGALASLEKTILKLDTKKEITTHIKKWTLPLGLPLILASFLGYGATTYEPQKLEMPNTNQVQGMLYKPKTEKQKPIEFESEKIENLPKVHGLGFMAGGINKMAKNCTDNRIVAYLAKTHQQTITKLGAIGSNVYTKKQFETYMAYTSHDERQVSMTGNGPVWPVIGKSIEVALTQSETTAGKVDLEDVMAITRLGIEIVDKAKRISRSLDYKIYRTAKDNNGEYVIPERETRFINNWIAYYHADIDD